MALLHGNLHYLAVLSESNMNYADINRYNLGNVIDHSVFVVKDINMFLKACINHKVKINKGIQSKRGELNTCMYYLSTLDREFIVKTCTQNKALYDKAITSDINIDKFSFKNVHRRLGRVRTYTTVHNIPKSKGKTFVVNKNSKRFQYNEIFEYLQKYLSNSAINHDTELSIEKTLLNSSHILDSVSGDIDYNIINSKLRQVMFSKIE